METPASRLAAVLASCVSADNGIRNAGEEALKKFTTDSKYSILLLEVVQRSQDRQVQQLALTELRKRIIQQPMELGQQGRAKVKEILCEALLRNGNSSTTRKLGAEALAATAKKALPSGEWPDFLPWLHEASKKPDAALKEVALIVSGFLVAYLGAQMQQHFPMLADMCFSGLNDGHPNVQRAALVDLGTLIACTPEESQGDTYQTLLLALFQLAQKTVASDDEETAVEALTTITDVVESSVPLLPQHQPLLITWCLQVATEASKAPVVRHSALQVVEGMARNKPKQFVKTGLIGQVVAALCGMCAEPALEDCGDDDDDLQGSRLASQALDTLAQELPSAQVFPIMLEYAQRHIGSSNLDQRRAACEVLLVAAEGCTKLMRKNLQTVLQVLALGIKDQEAKVRGAAVFALAEMAQHCQPEIGRQALSILPAITATVNDPDETVQDQACYALQTFCENLDAESAAADFLEGTMASLGSVLQNSKPGVRTSALRAIGSAAVAAGPPFVAYVKELLPVLQHYMLATEAELLQCRSAATECLGLVVEAVGTAALQTSLPDLIFAALQGLTLGDSELRESTHIMLASMAQKMGADFSPWLATATGAALESLGLDDGGETSGEDAASVSLASSSNSDDADHDTKRITIHTAVLEEKAAAMLAIGTYAECSPTAFLPFLEQAFNKNLRMATYFHDSIRDEAYTAFTRLLKAAVAAVPQQQAGNISQPVQHIADKAMPVLLAAIDDDDSKEAVASAVASMAEFVLSGTCQDKLQAVSQIATKLLTGKAICQEAGSEYEEWEEDDNGDNGDELIIQAVGELLHAMAKAGGHAYQEVWDREHFGPVMAHLRASKPSAVRAGTLGVLADVLRELKNTSVDLEKLQPILLRELRSEEPQNRQHAAYCLGIVGAIRPTLVKAHLVPLLQALHPLIANDEGAVRDNALGAIARMIMASDIASFPLEQVFPEVLKGLPIQVDFEEAEGVYSCLANIAADPVLRQRVNSHLPQLLAAFSSVQHQDDMPATIKERVLQMTAGLS